MVNYRLNKLKKEDRMLALRLFSEINELRSEFLLVDEPRAKEQEEDE